MAFPEDVEFPSAQGRPMRGFLALPPDQSGPRPGVLVLHEIFGLNDDIRRLTTRFAEGGYVAFAPDLYDGPGLRLACIVRVIQALRRGQGPAFDDLDAARTFLGDRPEVDASKIGVAGFCLGGGFTTLYAVRAPVGVAAPFYGEVPATADELRGICPVVGSYGGQDGMFVDQGRRLGSLLDELGVPNDVKVYEDAGHSFMSRHEGGFAGFLGRFGPMTVGYDPSAADDSWERMFRFFREHLDGAERSASAG